MFFFFVGGVNQQVGQVLKSGAGRCIACGSRADLVECEKVLQLFFVPVWRWPGKEPLMYCNNCNSLFPPKFSPPPPPSADSPPPRQLPDSAFSDVLRCQFCSREVDPSFRFCPFCGSSL
ncbi:uncharacterized protein LOC114300389 [Camellia sinensis]|uniref:Zinc-ribbon 15 domain-containing protein n=1 Tax=Camellia sinensis var. sinensis TaxID=542762 RepID=A0A4S4E4B6_CAMSN|nr:uncharacterized protein LOC114300389 [Camellia sinensis]THG10763.1 hypothetical protein TEA_010671 [Camellia sinensis var. sinensis]